MDSDHAGAKLRIFIDGGYFFKVFQPYRKIGIRNTMGRLTRRLSENYNLAGVHYFDSINKRDEAVRQKQEKFYYGYLQDKLGWNVEILDLQWPGGVAKQKGVDTSLAVCMHSRGIAGEFEVGIIVAADSDFAPATKLICQAGRVMRNAYFSARKSHDLSVACNGKPIRIDEIDFCYEDGSPNKLVSLDAYFALHPEKKKLLLK